MKSVISLRFLVQRWRELAMRDGYTDHNTVIYAEQVMGGYLPAFVVSDGKQIVVRMKAPLPTALAARNCLRDVLWGAHVEHRINLNENPATQEHAA